MPNSELTQVAPAGLPDLVPTTTMEIDASDIAYPRMKISHPSQVDFVPDLVPPFAIYSELNKDDDNKKTLFALPKGATKPDLEKDPNAGILIHVLAMRKGKSASMLNGQPVRKNTPGSEFRSWAFNDPNAPSGRDVDITYNYVVYAPELEDGDRPHRILMTRTSTSTARSINTLIDLAQKAGRPAYTLAFRLTTERRESTDDGGQTYRWGVYKFRQVEANQDDIEAASAMTAMVNASGAESSRDRSTVEATGDEPEI